jgi:glycosyltransferase involved in cell wall biosynthesis
LNNFCIYLDGLFYKGAGIGRYYESLLKGLAKEGVKIYTCVPLELKKDFESDFKQYYKNIIPIYVNYKGFSVKAFYSQGKILKKLEKEVSLYHFPHVNVPKYAPNNLVVTIHDLCPFTEFWDRGYLKRKIFELYFRRAAKKAKKIITDSKIIEKETITYYPKCISKVNTIYLFVDEKFYNKNSKRKYNKKIIEDEYLLFIGNRKKHKNLYNLVVAFNSIKNKFPHLKLVIAGKKDIKNDEVDLLKDKYDLKEKIIEINFPNDKEIINLYQHATAFIFPSLYEGFGLPPLEAMAMGIPVLVSNISVLKEICGDAVYFINPYNAEDMSKGIYKILSDNNLRKLLIEKGKNRIKLFNPDKIIDQYIEMYKEVLDEKS